MGKPKRPRLNAPRGVVAIPRHMIESPAYRALSPAARAAIIELQNPWQPSEPEIHFSTRRLAKCLGVGQTTAVSVLHELIEKGFIRIINESDLMARKARVYKLTWMPFHDREPTEEWGKYDPAKRVVRTVSGADKPQSEPSQEQIARKRPKPVFPGVGTEQSKRL